MTSLCPVCTSFANGSLSVSLRAWPASSSSLFLTNTLRPYPFDRLGCWLKPGRTRGSKIPPFVPRWLLNESEPFCWAVRSFPIPKQNRISSIYEECSPWNISRNAPQNAQKKAVLAPFASLFATSPFCWAVFHKCSTEPHFMFHNDNQPINKIGLRNEIPWNTMFHAPFSDVPRNVPRHHLFDWGVRN